MLASQEEVEKAVLGVLGRSPSPLNFRQISRCVDYLDAEVIGAMFRLLAKKRVATTHRHPTTYEIAAGRVFVQAA